MAFSTLAGWVLGVLGALSVWFVGNVRDVYAQGSAPADVTAQVTVTQTGLTFNRITGTFDTVVPITNSSSTGLNGPVALVLTKF